MKVLDQLIEKAKKRPLRAVFLFSLLLRLVYLLFNFQLWWDSHVYIGMGKYIFSSGELGFWESFRPVIHPFFLGLFWKAGFNIIILGKILDVVLSLMVIYFTYKIAETVFSRKVAVISSLILSLMPVFVILTGLILSEPLALTLGLGGIYVFITAKRAISLIPAGIILGLAFLTKFPLGIFFGSTLLILFLRKNSYLSKIKEIAFL